VPTEEFRSTIKVYPDRDYARYQYFQDGNRIAETDDNITLASLGICFGQNLLYRLSWVSPSDLHKQDMLHTVYLGIFKHMMHWIQGFLKKHRPLDAFDKVWKTLPFYPGFLVPKKGYQCAQRPPCSQARCSLQNQGLQMREFSAPARRRSVRQRCQLRAPIQRLWPSYSLNYRGCKCVYYSGHRDNAGLGPPDTGGRMALDCQQPD